ncbi:MAG: SDR family NAD(P)-dependent oxidoreductase [Holophagales bacterium]|nr:SDR family NAD(P)-dependent oxidoreductase [Holophagales bacterium]MYJ27061.1 SDR family NAD(P)-dependent oxidoreductase [Holophagales bacterium]
MSRFADRIAVVAGATGAIGGAVARALAAEGASLLLLGRDEARLREMGAELEAGSGAVRTVAGDLTGQAAVGEAGAAAESLGDGVDLLVHAAGAFRAGAVESAPIADLDLQFAVNVRAPYVLTRRLLPALRARRGLVVFVNSTAGLGAGAGSVAYAASKHALRAVADGLRAEVNADGVRVLSVYPGRTRGRMQREVCRGLGQRYDAERFLDPADVATAIIDATALPPSAEVYDLRLRPASKPRL